jgi:hypothetical protein
MTRLFYTILLALFFSSVSYAQKFSYGVILGGNAYDIEVDGPISGGTATSSLNFGAFAEYQISNRFGIKANLISNKTTERHSYDISAPNGGGDTRIFDKIELKTLQAHALLKFDFTDSYKTGMYLAGGFRMTSILDEDAEDDTELLDGFYNSTNYGALLGFGINILKHFNVELLGDYSISNVIDSDTSKPQNLGLYLNIYVHIGSLISNK